MQQVQFLLQLLRDPAWGAIGVLISLPLAFLGGKQSKAEFGPLSQPIAMIDKHAEKNLSLSRAVPETARDNETKGADTEL